MLRAIQIGLAAALLLMAAPALSDETTYCKAAAADATQIAADSRALSQKAAALLPDDVEHRVVVDGDLSIIDGDVNRQALADAITAHNPPSYGIQMRDQVLAAAALIRPLEELAERSDIAAKAFKECAGQ